MIGDIKINIGDKITLDEPRTMFCSAGVHEYFFAGFDPCFNSFGRQFVFLVSNKDEVNNPNYFMRFTQEYIEAHSINHIERIKE